MKDNIELYYNKPLINQVTTYIEKLSKYIGTKINQLTIIGLYYNQQYDREYRYQFKCKCDCNQIIYKSTKSILRNIVKSCGSSCPYKHIQSHLHLINTKINNLIILDIIYDQSKPSNSRIYYKCKCDCGSINLFKYQNIIAKKRPTKSCGCKINYYKEIENSLIQYLNLNDIELLEEYVGMMEDTNSKINNVGFKQKVYQLKCNICGFNFTKVLVKNLDNLCPNCYPQINKIEFKFHKWLNQNNIQSIQHKRIYSKSNIQEQIEIDFIINKIGIELHGLITHATTYYDYKSPFIGIKPKNYHLNKTESCEEQNIDLLQFWNTELIQKENIVKSIILNRLGKTKYKEYARNCIIKEIDKITYDIFIKNNHIQGISYGEQIRLGLFYKKNNNLVSVMSFGYNRYSNYQWEMFRFANHINCNIIGAASKLFKYFIKTYNPTSIVSYSDRRIFNNGKLYDILGFKLDHISSPNYWYFKKNCQDYNNKLYHRSSFMKHKLKDKLKLFDPNLTEWENMELNGYLRVYDCGNKVYIWTTLRRI